MLQRITWNSEDPCFEGLPQVLASTCTPGWRKKQDSEKQCSDTLIAGGCLEEMASTESTARAKQVSSPLGWLGPSSPLHPSTHLCTQSGLSRRQRSRSGQRDGVQFPRRWTNPTIWFCHGSHGLLAKEIKAYLFLAQDRYRFLGLCVSRAWISSLTIAFILATPKLQHLSSYLLGNQPFSYQTNFLIN